MSGKIQRKFFVSIFVVVLIPLVVCIMLFGKNMRNTSYKNARENDYFNMQQVVKRLEADLNNVEVIGNSCSYREDIRNFLLKKDEMGAHEYVSTLFQIGEDLAFYQNISPYIQSIGITQNEKFSYWKYISSYDDECQMNIFEESWYKEYLQSEKISYYSQIHQVPSDSTFGTTEPVISRVKKIVDINRKVYLGEIIINIKVNEIQKALKEMDSEFDDIILELQEELLVVGKDSREDAQYYLEHKRLHRGDKTCTYYDLNGRRMIRMPMAEEYGINVYGICSNKKVMQEIVKSIVFLVLVSCLCLLLIMKVMFSVIKQITKPIVELTAAVDEISKGNLDIQVHVESNDEVETLANGINTMVVRQKKFISKLLEYEEKQKEYEFEILLSQINPHFLYNTLNTISFLALRYKHDDIHAITTSLIRLLQNSIQTDGNRIMACVKNEVEVVGQYVTIQKYRYKNQFTILYQIEEGIEDVMIPKSIIQPLVENALFHGICPKGSPGTIMLVIKKCALNSLAIIVKDDGIGMAEKVVQNPEIKTYTKHSIGLTNIRGRLKHLYGTEWLMDIQSKSGEGTIILTVIPEKPQKNNRLIEEIRK